MPIGIAPRDGVGKAHFYSISSFTSFIPSNPGTGRVLVPVSHFGPRAAPKLYGSPELGVLIPSCIGDLAGAKKKGTNMVYMVYIC